MSEKIEEKTVAAKILSYETTHVAIAAIGGKNFRVNIPANSDHPTVGECKFKNKWRKREFSKEEQAALESKKEAARKSDTSEK